MTVDTSTVVSPAGQPQRPGPPVLLPLPLRFQRQQALTGPSNGRKRGLHAVANVGVPSRAGSVVFDASGSWTCPAGVFWVSAEGWGGGGGGSGGQDNRGYAGGGGGAYAVTQWIPVTPGTTYTVTVGTGGVGANSPTNPGGAAGNGADSSFVGDSGATVVAKGGSGGPNPGDNAGDHGSGGSAASSTGDAKFSGGDGGSAIGGGAGQAGAGGGASGNPVAAGNAGSNVPSTTGGVGANGGGSGGNGSGNHLNNATAGSVPGGGGGGGANGLSTTEGAASGAHGRIVLTYPPVQDRGLHAAANVGAGAAFSGKRGLHAVASITRVLMSQEAVEVLYDTTGATARVSQDAVEVLTRYPVLGNRISQVAVEILLQDTISLPFIPSATAVYPPALFFTGTKAQTAKARVSKSLTKAQTAKARISHAVTKTQTSTARVQNGAVTKAQTATARIFVAELDLPFISSRTVVYGVWSMFDPNQTYSASGNGGERFGLRLNANGTTTTATLASAIGLAGTPSLTMTGDSGMPPAGVSFVVTIDSEQILVVSQGAGGYLIRRRGMGNTTIATHSGGATVSWDDTYYMPIVSSVYLNTDFTANIEGTGSSLYTGWLMAFDSTQAYVSSSGDRYPMHIAELTGVFAAGAGTTGASKTDGPQPSAVHAPEAPSDHCAAGLTVPALIQTNIVPGDVVVCRYTNPESYELDLGPRAGAIQSWYGLKRVDTTDHDVTYTDPNGIVVDTKSGYATYTGSANVEPDEPLALQPGVARDSSDAAGHAVPTPSDVPWLDVTLPGTDRYFTDGIHYSEKGWPVGVITCRQGNRRIPYWQSWDWHDFNYIYSGFGTDDSFAQLVINRNGMTGVLPTISLPGPQDIDGPAAYWDDATYYFGASWFVVLVATPYLVFGPVIVPPGGPGGGGVSPVGVPGVTFPPGGGPPVISPPPTVEGGSGGNITPSSTGLHVWTIF